MVILDEFYGKEGDGYDSSHLPDDDKEKETPPEYIISEKLLIKAELGESVSLADSDIHGVGLFASKDISKGEFLQYTHVYHQKIRWWLSLTPNYKYNHSPTENNCEVVEGNRCMKMIALRDIKKGEELLVDYSENDRLEDPKEDYI